MVFDYKGQLKTGDIILHCWSSFPGIHMHQHNCGYIIFHCSCAWVKGAPPVCVCVSHARWTWRDAEPHRNCSDQPLHWECYSTAHQFSRVFLAPCHLPSLWQGQLAVNCAHSRLETHSCVTGLAHQTMCHIQRIPAAMHISSNCTESKQFALAWDLTDTVSKHLSPLAFVIAVARCTSLDYDETVAVGMGGSGCAQPA